MNKDTKLVVVPEGAADQSVESVKTKKAKPESKGTRKGVTLPESSAFEFKAGQQVYLVNLKHAGERKFRSHYEYVRRAGKMDVVKSSLDGKERRVWLNKLMPKTQALALQKQVAAEAKAKAAAKAEKATA